MSFILNYQVLQYKQVLLFRARRSYDEKPRLSALKSGTQLTKDLKWTPERSVIGRILRGSHGVGYLYAKCYPTI